MARFDIDDPQALAEIARDYYVNEDSQRDIAKARGGVNQSTVAHWLRRAKERGVVAIDIDADFALAGREHRDRSRQLRDMYGLRECLVVDPVGEKLYEDQRSNDLHTTIANTSGVRLREWIQSGDHIVVGGGRAPVRVARFIKRTPPARREIRISPLSGRIWTGSWQEDGPENLQRPLDADDAARLLGFAFEHEPGTRFSQIGHPLYAESPELAKQIVKSECVFQPGQGWNVSWGLHPPIRALVGVGVLHPRSGHRIIEFLKLSAAYPKQPTAQHLRWAASKFKEAIKFVESRQLPFFGDVANRLFPALPLPSELKDKTPPSLELYDRLASMLEELNSHAVVMNWNHLRGIPSVWAVAGGDLKVQVLWTLLICRHLEQDRNNSLIKELSTDLKTAEQLQQALRDFDDSTGEVRKWYETVAPRVFPNPSERVRRKP